MPTVGIWAVIAATAVVVVRNEMYARCTKSPTRPESTYDERVTGEHYATIEYEFRQALEVRRRVRGRVPRTPPQRTVIDSLLPHR